MSINQGSIQKAFMYLIRNWDNQDPGFKHSYRSYKSKFLRNKSDPDLEGIGFWKKVEMLAIAGYVEIKVKLPKK
jgi:hypothetical protein